MYSLTTIAWQLSKARSTYNLRLTSRSRVARRHLNQRSCISCCISVDTASNMASEAAQQAKSDGSFAWSAGNYAQAAEHFTTAINIGGDKEFLKVLYSNRSAAYLKLSKVTEALRDGNKCVELDSNWAKGYVRKGDALLASKQYTEAYNAYNSAARIAPSDATVKEKCDQAMRAMRNAADATANFARSAGSTGSTGSPSSPSPAPLYVQYAHLAILVLIVLYCIPLFPTSYRNISHK